MKLPTIHRDAKGRFILTRGKTGKLRRLYIKRGLSRDALIKWLINLILKRKKRTRKQGQVKGRQPSKQSIPYVPSERRIESEKKEAEEYYERGVRHRNEMMVNTPHGKVVVSKSPDEEVGFVHGPGTYSHGPGGMQVTTPGPKKAPYLPSVSEEKKYNPPQEREEDYEINRLIKVLEDKIVKSESRSPTQIKEEKIPSAPPAPLSANKIKKEKFEKARIERMKVIEQNKKKAEELKPKKEEAEKKKAEELKRKKEEAEKKKAEIKKNKEKAREETEQILMAKAEDDKTNEDMAKRIEKNKADQIEQEKREKEKKDLDDKLKHEEGLIRRREELEKARIAKENENKAREERMKKEEEENKNKALAKATEDRLKRTKEEGRLAKEKIDRMAKEEEEKLKQEAKKREEVKVNPQAVARWEVEVSKYEQKLADAERKLEKGKRQLDEGYDNNISAGDEDHLLTTIASLEFKVKSFKQSVVDAKKLLERVKAGETEAQLYNKPKTGSGIRSEKGLSDLDINKVMDRYKPMGYLGVVMCDEIPKLVPRVHPRSRISFVMNTDPASKEGRHWVSVYCDCRDSTPSPSLEYYNSFGTPPSQTFLRDIKPLMEKMNPKQYPRFKVNKIADQSNSSTNCGSFAMKFLIRRYRGEPFTEVTGYDDSRRGEKGIERFKHEEKIGSGKFPLMLV